MARPSRPCFTGWKPVPRPGSSGAARPMGERRNLQPGGIVGWHGQSGSAVWRRIVRDATRHRKTSTALVNSLPVLTTRTRQTDALSVPPSALRQTARLPRRLTPPRNDKGYALNGYGLEARATRAQMCAGTRLRCPVNGYEAGVKIGATRCQLPHRASAEAKVGYGRFPYPPSPPPPKHFRSAQMACAESSMCGDAFSGYPCSTRSMILTCRSRSSRFQYSL